MLADQGQFALLLPADTGIGELQPGYRVENDLRDEQASILLVVSGNNIPGRFLGAGGGDAFPIDLHVLVPEFAFLDIGQAELPILVRIVDAGEETLALLVLGEMEEEFDDSCAVAGEM